MNKKVIIAILVVLMVVLGGSAIYIAVKLSSEEPVVPEEAKAATATCSGQCGSGDDCNNNPDPDVGNMWGCLSSSSGYVCQQIPITYKNEDGNCWLDPRCNWQVSCNCNVGECENICRGKLTGTTTYAKHTMTCGDGNTTGCGQKFTCDCSRTITNTPTITVTTPVTITVTTPITITVTTPVTITVTITSPVTITITTPITLSVTQPVTTIPETALITDEVDRVLIGIGMIFLGIIFYKNNIYYSAFFFIKNGLIGKSTNTDKFENEIQKKYKDKSD